ncbi:copper amine oxidase N-terminal domain-containing protein [Bacillus solimangrovi]|uniref:Copper amine oxidase-like N-terminal domain-containing protein n=1 Tax=Bacillus solimangrovi TaxID=1305675 RepID=A0A1E5LC54_9BACI|nr:copper amine oxidase N-terminal domain-containing protein [Bacillus solimangrovi]OEH91579.1 hypothetical protein BFG57_04180 [Bacillus solimangrovi]
MNKNTWFFLLIGLTILLFSYTPQEVSAKVMIDGAVLKEGRIYVPMRALFESMGANVSWDQDTRTITAKLEGEDVQIQIGEHFLMKNGEKMLIDSPAFIHNERTLISLRNAAEAFGGLVNWDGEQNIASYKLNGQETVVIVGKVIDENFLTYLEEGTFNTCPFSMVDPPTVGEVKAKYGEPIDIYDGSSSYAMILEDVSCSPTVDKSQDKESDKITGLMYYHIEDDLTLLKFVDVVGSIPTKGGFNQASNKYVVSYERGQFKAIVTAIDLESKVEGIYIK